MLSPRHRGDIMAVLTVRNVPDEAHRALRVRATQHGRSAEAEVREILSAALVPDRRILLGNALASLGRALDLTDDDVATLDAVRDQTPAECFRSIKKLHGVMRTWPWRPGPSATHFRLQTGISLQQPRHMGSPWPPGTSSASRTQVLNSLTS